MNTNNNSILVTFDKSHILTLGRKMYSESVNLIRELVNNSYDADATKVNIELTKDKIIVADNGLGMDLKDLTNYFKIGSQLKKQNKLSKIYKRKFIGEIGIGKFSSFGATNKFELITQKEGFKARVVFDQNEWSKSSTDWELPYFLMEAVKGESDGTSIILHDVEYNFTPNEVVERLRISVPLDAKYFEVFINKKKIEPLFIDGKRFLINISTEFGDIYGQIILSDKPLPFKEIGIICCVKDVMITRNLFGFEDYGHGTRKITGRINADFLEFTANRDNFIITTVAYRAFFKAMREEVKKIVGFLKSEEDEKKIAQNRKAISKASEILKKAFLQLPDYLKEMKITVSKGHTGKVEEENVEGSVWQEKTSKIEKTPNNKKAKRGEYNIIHINPVTQNKSLKNIKTDLGFNFGFVDEGETGPPSYFYNNTIYVNREHSLYKKYSIKIDDEIKYLVDILVSESIMLTSPSDLRQYYERRVEVLTKAFE